MRVVFVLGALASAGLAASARAAVTFTFFDPATGPEISYIAGTDNATDPGVLTWIGAPVTLTVDGTDHGLGVAPFTANVTMSLDVGAVTGVEGGILTAPILNGVLSFTDAGSGNTILSGAIGTDAGAVIALGTTGNILAQGAGAPGGLVWTAGSALDSFLGGLSLAPIYDANFTLTSLSPAIGMNPQGFLNSFTANSAFTGNASIPAPGALCLFTVSGLAWSRRRR